MKRNSLIIILMSLLFFACDSKLEKKPYNGLVEDQVFSSTQGFNDAIKGVYSGFRLNGYYGSDASIILTSEALTDNVMFNTQGRQTLKNLFNWKNTAVNEYFGLYWSGYRIISRTNKIINSIDKIEKSDFRDNIEAQALAVRALVHFDIANIYCKIPTQDANAGASLGIPYLTEFDVSMKPRRVGTTVDGVYDKVIADLMKSLELIGNQNPNTRITKKAVLGLLSRVYLFKGDYDNAVSYADKAIAEGIEITPRDKFTDIWTEEYDGNILFQIAIIDDDRVATGNVYSQEAKGEVRSEYVVSFGLYGLYKDSDIRKSTTIQTSVYSGNMYNHVAKYFGRKVGNKNVINGKYLRAEEIYLNKAEALYKLGREAEALATLDLLRDERYESFTSPNETGDNLRDAIRLERRLELAFEGDRFLQIKRLGLGLTRDNKGEFADGTGTPPILLTYPADGERWQQPIPKGAFDSNSNMTDEDQNPGY